MNDPRQKGGQGQSAATISKERRIGAALSVSMSIASAKFGGGRYRFWAFDANAGSGWNDEVGVAGSPLMFMETAAERLTDMPATAFFCDIDVKALTTLKAKLISRPPMRGVDWHLLPGDNEDALDVFAEYIRAHENPAYAVGAVVVDPNGYFYRNQKGEGPPTSALVRFCQSFPRIDVILNLNVRTYKLQKGSDHAVEPPEAVLRGLGKKHWLVGRSFAGNARFLLAVGRNLATGDHRSLGLYDWQSAIGRQILDAAAGGQQGSLDYELPGLFAASGLPRGPAGGHAAGRREVPVRGPGHGSAPPEIPAMGHVRRAE